VNFILTRIYRQPVPQLLVLITAFKKTVHGDATVTLQVRLPTSNQNHRHHTIHTNTNDNTNNNTNTNDNDHGLQEDGARRRDSHSAGASPYL
jgi:hypothetical protein